MTDSVTPESGDSRPTDPDDIVRDPFDPDTFDPDASSCYNGLFGLGYTPDQSKLVVIPVPFDATASYRKGASDAPMAVLKASWQVDLRDIETGDPWRQGICMLPVDAFVSDLNDRARWYAETVNDTAGDKRSETMIHDAVAQVNQIGKQLAEWVSDQSRLWLDKGKLVAVLGGDHSCPLGLIEQLATRHEAMGIVHFDAHADLRHAYQNFVYSHASIMHNVLHQVPKVASITQIAVRDLCAGEMHVIETNPRVHCYYDVNIARRLFEGQSFSAITDDIVSTLPREIYISFDIDALEPSLCPNTGTPVPGGLGFQQACYILHQLVASGRRIVGFDLCEVGPFPADAIVGARILYKLIGWLLKSHEAAASKQTNRYR